MNTKSTLLTGLLCLLGLGSLHATKYVGGDISELPTMENAKAKYYDKNGGTISDLITYSYDQGMNAMRVRLFVDPDNFNATNPSVADPYACQDYEYILPICKRIKAAGHKLLLDFHYSDTWADPAKQYTPASWASLSNEDLYKKIYDYTKEVLADLKAQGAEPDFIQTGNEISYGMCWGAYGSSNLQKVYTARENTGSNAANLTRFKNLLENAIKACREVSPEAKIVLHTERTPQPSVLTSFYDWAQPLDYDIIGLSYYPYYHGKMSVLEDALYALELKNYGKEIWIVETGSAIVYTIGDADKQFYEATDEGQNKFATDLLAALDNHPSVTGLFWWEMDYNAKGTSLTNWYNASLFSNSTGQATSAFYTIAGWANDDNEGPGNETDPTYPNYYLLYNQGGDWNVPGTIFENHQDGTYSLDNIEIYQTGSDYGWFAITSVNSTSWDIINSYRYGPLSNNEDPIADGVSPVEKNENSWQIAAGTYSLVFDANEMTLTVKVIGNDENQPGDGDDENQPGDDDDENQPGDGDDENQPGDEDNEDTTGVAGIETDNNEAIYFNLQGIRVNNPQKGLYIKVVNGKNQKVIIR